MKKLPLLLSLLMLLSCGQQKSTTNTTDTPKADKVHADTPTAAVTKTADTAKVITTDAGNPANYKSLFNDGINFYNAQQYEQALGAFKTSNSLNHNTKTDYYIALTYSVMKNCDSSIVYAQKVLKTGDGDTNHTNNSTKMIALCSPPVTDNTNTQTNSKYEFMKKIPAKDYPVFTRTDSVRFKIINKKIYPTLQLQKHF